MAARTKTKTPEAVPSRLTLGPLFFHWDAERRRDFYFRIADEAPVDIVVLGEVVCSKREPFFAPHRRAVIERLRKAGKEVVLSTLALLTTEKESDALQEAVAEGLRVEANDVACLQALAGKPFVAGPFINVLNEGTRDFMAALGAERIVLASELPETSIAILAAGKTPVEVQIFGRQPLSVAMRCYHARANGLTKDNCQFSCEADPDGLTASTLDGQPILTVSGTQTLTHGSVMLFRDLARLQAEGVRHFRLSPQALDMVEVARLARAVLDGALEAEEAENRVRALTDMPFINGFLRGREGLAWVGLGCS